MKFAIQALIISFVATILCVNEMYSQNLVSLKGPFDGSFRDFVVSSNNSSLAYAAGGDGIFRSTDSGADWTKIIDGSYKCISISAANNNYVVTDISISTNGGASWQTYNQPDSSRIDDILFIQDTTLISTGPASIGYGLSIFMSTDLGLTWSKRGSVDCYAFLGYSFAMDTSSSNLFLLAIQDQSTYRPHLYESTDKGLTWNNIVGTINGASFDTYAAQSINKLLVYGQEMYFTSSPSIYRAGPIGAYKSTDGGLTWSSLYTGNACFDIALNPSNHNNIFIGTSEGVQRTTNAGSSWQSVGPAFVGGSYYSPVIATINYLLVGADNYDQGYGILKSTDAGLNFYSVGGLTVTARKLLANDSAYLFCSSVYSGVLSYTSDGGNDWIPIGQVKDFYSDGNSPPKIVGNFYDSIGFSNNLGANWMYKKISSNPSILCVNPQNESEIYTSDNNSISKSTDGGISWGIVSLPAGETDVENLAANPKTGTLFLEANTFKLYRSIDKGNSWNISNQGLVSLNEAIQDFSFSNSTGNLFCIGNYSYLYKSTNDGVSWNNIYQNYGLAVSGPIAVDPATEQKLYSYSNSGGLVGSSDGGSSWGPLQGGNQITSTPVLTVVNSTLYVGTSAGLFKVNPMILSSVTSLNATVPKQFALSQNFPNPFNPTTTISYSIPNRSHVTLSVFNTLGQKISELINAEKEPGVYTAPFDASGFASGVYFYRMQAGSYVDTKKLMLLK